MDFSNYDRIRKQLPSHVRLIAVSKLQPESAIQSLAEHGQKSFAENYVQEALPKQEHLKSFALDWHFIGHLQRNKVKQVVGQFSLIHSVDRVELAAEIDKVAVGLGIVQSVLLEINAADEGSKSGFPSTTPAETFLEVASKYRNIRIEGLMTMPPLFDDPELARPYFQRARHLRDRLLTSIPSCRELSMGTSSDFSIAIAEGATLIRLGTVLFGPRPG